MRVNRSFFFLVFFTISSLVTNGQNEVITQPPAKKRAILGAITNKEEQEQQMTEETKAKRNSMAYADMLKIAHQYPDRTDVQDFDTFLALEEMIKNGELSYVSETINGITYKGWVNAQGLPHGIFRVEKGYSNHFCSPFNNGIPFSFGSKEIDGIKLVGKFDSKFFANGIGFLRWPSGGYYGGGLKNNFQHGNGVTYKPSGYIDRDLTGWFENGKFVKKAYNVALEYYNANKDKMLDKNLRVVENMDLNGKIYSGNWKDGGKAGFGFLVEESENTYYVGNYDKSRNTCRCWGENISFDEEIQLAATTLLISEWNNSAGYEKTIVNRSNGTKYQYHSANNMRTTIEITREKEPVGESVLCNCSGIKIKNINNGSAFYIDIEGNRKFHDTEKHRIVNYSPDGTIMVLCEDIPIAGDYLYYKLMPNNTIFLGEGKAKNSYLEDLEKFDFYKYESGCLFFDDGEFAQQKCDDKYVTIYKSYINKVLEELKELKAHQSKPVKLSSSFRYTF